MATDGDGTITVLEPGGKALASHVGLDWNVGDRPGPADIERLADHMADVVLTLAQGGQRQSRDGTTLAEPSPEHQRRL